jgi:hypothetical protein
MVRALVTASRRQNIAAGAVTIVFNLHNIV